MSAGTGYPRSYIVKIGAMFLGGGGAAGGGGCGLLLHRNVPRGTLVIRIADFGFRIADCRSGGRPSPWPSPGYRVEGGSRRRARRGARGRVGLRGFCGLGRRVVAGWLGLGRWAF